MSVSATWNLWGSTENLFFVMVDFRCRDGDVYLCQMAISLFRCQCTNLLLHRQSKSYEHVSIYFSVLKLLFDDPHSIKLKLDYAFSIIQFRSLLQLSQKKFALYLPNNIFFRSTLLPVS